MKTQESPCFAGIDTGTTGVSVAIFDGGGRTLGSGDCEYPCLYPRPGWVEQDLETVWRGICDASHAALAQAQIDPQRIQSVGFSSQRGSFVLLDNQGRPLGPAVVWNDSRAREMEALIEQKLGRERFLEITGMPLSASWAVCKLAWLLKHRLELMARTRWICNGQEYFLRRLGAEEYVTDPSSLTLNGMLEIRKLEWSEDVCRAAGIDMALLPRIGKPGARAGSLSVRAAQETGFPTGIAICRGGGDQQCAAVGSGVIRHGFAEITVGTAAMMVAHLEHPDRMHGHSAYMGGHAVAGKWDMEGGSFAIGSSLRWWRDNFGQVEVDAGHKLHLSPYDLLTAQAATVPAGSRGALFHPFFAGQVTPFYDATARAGFFGLGLHHDRAHLARALLEGCSFEMRMMIDAIDHDLDGGITELRLTGGGAQSTVFAQIMADVFGRPAGVLKNRECTVLGAAILGAVGDGAFAGIGEAVDAMVTLERVFEPIAAHRAVYDDFYGAFKSMYRALADARMYSTLYDLAAKHF